MQPTGVLDTAKATNPLKDLLKFGQSVWLDYIRRDLITSGELKRLIEEDGLRGMTSNPTIFEKAIAGSTDYADILASLKNRPDLDAKARYELIAIRDIQDAADLLRPVYQESKRRDGYISLEVSPYLARDTQGTLEEARRLWKAVDRPNIMIKVPGTAEGIPAFEQLISEGINVNVTLLFSVERYAEVIEAFLAGLEQRMERGLPIASIASVASFFVSRGDGKVDLALDRLPGGEPLRGTAAIANACTAYRLFESSLSQPRWSRLAAAGVRPQRPLWASTSTKDPRYPDTYYVEALVAPRTVNTLPPETLEAYRHHGNPAVRIQAGVDAAAEQLQALARAGIDLAQVTRELEDEGVEKFAASYRSLLAAIDGKVGQLV